MDEARREFEAWAKGWNLDLRRGKLEDDDESYIDDMTHGAFMGWQAATLAERERCADLAESLHANARADEIELAIRSRTE